jgi:chromosome segregation ATPase
MVRKKKKSRANKVGVMGAAAASASSVIPAAAAPPASAAPVPSPTSARDAAAEAARRAEEFMQQKTVEHAKASSSVPTTTTATSTFTTSAMQVPTYDDIPDVLPSASTDTEVAAAQKAAEDHRQMQQIQSQKIVPGGFMGTFFKGFGGSSSSLGSQGNNNSQTAGRRPSPTPTITANANNEGVDRLAKQQQDMQRAMAERQMQMQQQISKNTNDDDDEVVVSTSASGYHQPEPPATTTTTVTTPITTTFAPAKQRKTATTPQKIVVREVAPSPKKHKTPTQVFADYQALFAQSVHRAMQHVENVRSQQKMLLEERFLALAKANLSTQQIAQTETQLQVAVDEEDYELADQLGQVLEAHKREKYEVASMLESIALGLTQLESQKTLVVQAVASCFDQLAARLTELQGQEAETEQTNDTETLKQFHSISKQLSAEQERLQHDCKHLERDKQLVADERKELESAISEQSGEYERQQDAVKSKLSEVEAEMEELRKQLAAKQIDAAGLRTEMFGLEDSISKVRVKFARQLTRVDKKERALSENRNEWESESTAHTRQKEAHEMQVQAHSTALLEHDALMNMLESELKLSKEFAEMVPTKIGFLEDEAANAQEKDDDDKKEGDLAQLQADVVKCEAAVSEAKILLKAATGFIRNLDSEYGQLIAKIPDLEAQKKAAAAKRDFKAAGKASKDIKDATARLKECEQELVGEAANRKSGAEEELWGLSLNETTRCRIGQYAQSGARKRKGIGFDQNGSAGQKNPAVGGHQNRIVWQNDVFRKQR